MRQNRSLKFSHNYFSLENTALRKRESRIIVESGMHEKHTRVFTDRAHHLQCSGIYKLLLARVYENLERAEPRLERVAIPDFAPLTLHHIWVSLHHTPLQLRSELNANEFENYVRACREKRKRSFRRLNQKCRYFEELRAVIRNNLTQPKTAFWTAEGYTVEMLHNGMGFNGYFT